MEYIGMVFVALLVAVLVGIAIGGIKITFKIQKKVGGKE